MKKKWIDRVFYIVLVLMAVAAVIATWRGCLIFEKEMKGEKYEKCME